MDYELTEYVVTRWYRAPEVMCSCQEYDFKSKPPSASCLLHCYVLILCPFRSRYLGCRLYLG